MTEPPESISSDFMAPIFSEIERSLRPALTPLAAEVIGSQLLGTVALSLQSAESGPEVSTGIVDFITELITYARADATVGALAVLRAVAAVAPPQLRQRVNTAAMDLAGSGKTDRAWAADIGRPVPVRSWQCGDTAGAQAAITAVFRYGRAEHALTVLLDHQLGGGVKDCWLSQNPGLLWQRSQEAGRIPHMRLTELPWAAAQDLLAQSLVLPACPTEPDQVQDVAAHMGLLQARVDLGQTDIVIVVSEADPDSRLQPEE
jgi:hypothetical protein